MAISYNGLRPIQRTAKPAREIPPPSAISEADQLVGSTTIVPINFLYARTDSGVPSPLELQQQGVNEVEIRVWNKGANTVYLVWGTWSTDPAAADIAGPPGYSDLPTTFVPPSDVRSFTLSATGEPFHLITGDGGGTSDCVVDRFIRRHHRL